MAKKSKEILNTYIKYFIPINKEISDDDYNDFMLNYEMFEPKLKQNKTNLISKKSFTQFIKNNNKNYR
jgi:hypothetical protein